MIVDVDVQATPSACKPVQYIVSVVSAVDYGKRSVQPGNNTGGYMPLHGRHLHVVLRPPVLRLPPYVASAAAVQENLREVLAKGTYNNVRIESFACPQALMCVVTFGRAPGEGVVRVRYVLTGYRQRPGCWFVSRDDVLYPTPDRVESPLQPFVPLNNQAWCLSWRKP